MRDHRWPLLAMGVVSGYLGAAPTLLWASARRRWSWRRCWWSCRCGCTRWSSRSPRCWFAHFALDALQRLRMRAERPNRALDRRAAAASLPRRRRRLPHRHLPPP